jgi:large subunit ribosomal protein L24
MARIRKNDMVEVIAGNDRGKRGRVLRLVNKKNRIVVQGVNIRWKHLRKSQQAPQGGRVQRETPIHMSNVMLYDEAAGVRSRVSYKTGADGRTTRVLRKTGKEVGAVVEKAAKQPKAAKKKTKAKGRTEKES